LPYKAAIPLQKLNGILFTPEQEENSNSISDMKSGSKKHRIHHSINIITWALVEDVERAEDKS
jgi:hypothetical protein